MSCHNGFKKLCRQVASVMAGKKIEEKHATFRSENKAKQN